jgi:RNA polymerase sigma-70 factor (ECF subfamily)
MTLEQAKKPISCNPPAPPTVLNHSRVSIQEPEPAPDWNETVELAKQGCDGAATRLVEGLYGHVLRIVRNHLPRGLDEQDLVQEVFMKVFASIDSFRGMQPFPHWVARIALNACHDQLRRQKARPEVRFSDLCEADAGFVDALLEGDSSASGGAVEAGGRELVERLLATLKPDERMVLQLLDLEKKSLREVCELTGWGLSRVKVGAMRARRKLNDQLKRLERERTP